MDKVEKFSAIDRSDKWTQNWWSQVTSDDPIIDLTEALPLWRNKSRFEYYNNPVAKAPIQNLANLTIGGGIYPNPIIDIEDSRKKHEIYDAIVKLHEEWATHANIDGVTDLSSTLRQLLTAMFRDGDVLVYITTDDKGDFKIDLIDASRIDTPPDQKKSKNIKLGVETSKRSIKRYWIKTNNGTNKWISLPVKNQYGDMVSILLKNPYNSELINSYRGIPILAPCMSTVDDLNSVLRDELRATKINRSKVGVMNVGGPNTTDTVEAMSDEVIGRIGYQKHGDLEILVTQNGDTFTLHGGSDVSNPNIPDITKLYLKQIASVFNVPYNALYSDIDDNTYSTNQSILLEAWKSTEIIRKYLVQNLLKPLYRLNLEKWIIEGKIPHVKEYSDLISQVQFNGRAINSIKAKDHIEGQLAAIEGGLKSVQMAALENGDNPWQIMRDKIEYEAELNYQQDLKNINIQSKQEISENDHILKIVEMFYTGKISSIAAKTLLKDLYKYDDKTVDELIVEKDVVEEKILEKIDIEKLIPKPRAGI